MNRKRLSAWSVVGLISASVPAGAAAIGLEPSNQDGAAPSGARPNWKAEGEEQGARFGHSVATAGDVNGDGYDDIIVGAPERNIFGQGGAVVYHGSAWGLSHTPNWRAEAERPDDHLGFSVATAGDVNGDGYDDVIVGAPNIYDFPQIGDPGRAFVYHGSAWGLSHTANWMGLGGIDYLFGASVGTAGDVNGDGYDDVVVGAPLVGAQFYEPNEGAAFVYYGSASGLSTFADWMAEGDHNQAEFGTSVGTAGDVNGDGYADLIVGARYYTHDQLYEGGAVVYHGSASGLSHTPNWRAEGDQTYANFGTSVGKAGDVNGDGYDDVIVGAPLYNHGQPDEGRAFVYFGSASGLSATPDWTAERNQADAEFGTSVGSAGDLNGDGYDDVVVGAPFSDNGQGCCGEGGSFVYFGSASGPSASPDWTAEGNLPGVQFGFSVGRAGDVNGDDYDDMIGGAPGYNKDSGQSEEGLAVVFHGRGTPPIPLAKVETAGNEQH